LAKPANQSALTIATAPPTVQIQKPSAAPAVAGSQQPRPVQPTKPESQSAVTIATTPATVQAHKPPPAVAAPVTPQTRQASSSAKPESPSARTIAAPPAKMEMHKPEAQIAASSSSPAQPDRADEAVQKMNLQGATAFTRLANGFDFPVGKPDAKNYYKARGFRSHGHMGEDWDGIRGGDTDLNDPVYCIGDGVVVFARDCHQGWGNVIIVRHAFREGGTVKNIDSLYGHVQKMMVRKGDAVTRGQQIATIGNAHGLYDAHLHLEIRKNLEIGMSRAAFARDFGNYYDPTEFILSHRVLNTKGGTYRIAMNTFTHDKYIKWDKKKNFSNYRGGTGESARALKKALASQSVGGSR
jgi:murein DD-endopeptidase MepM/ murein hydrolase activator NlpD